MATEAGHLAASRLVQRPGPGAALSPAKCAPYNDGRRVAAATVRWSGDHNRPVAGLYSLRSSYGIPHLKSYTAEKFHRASCNETSLVRF